MRHAGGAGACACISLMPGDTEQVWCDMQVLQRPAPVSRHCQKAPAHLLRQCGSYAAGGVLQG